MKLRDAAALVPIALAPIALALGLSGCGGGSAAPLASPSGGPIAPPGGTVAGSSTATIVAKGGAKAYNGSTSALAGCAIATTTDGTVTVALLGDGRTIAATFPADARPDEPLRIRPLRTGPLRTGPGGNGDGATVTFAETDSEAVEGDGTAGTHVARARVWKAVGGAVTVASLQALHVSLKEIAFVPSDATAAEGTPANSAAGAFDLNAVLAGTHEVGL